MIYENNFLLQPGPVETGWSKGNWKKIRVGPVGTHLPDVPSFFPFFFCQMDRHEQTHILEKQTRWAIILLASFFYMCVCAWRPFIIVLPRLTRRALSYRRVAEWHWSSRTRTAAADHHSCLLFAYAVSNQSKLVASWLSQGASCM